MPGLDARAVVLEDQVRHRRAVCFVALGTHGNAAARNALAPYRLRGVEDQIADDLLDLHARTAHAPVARTLGSTSTVATALQLGAEPVGGLADDLLHVDRLDHPAGAAVALLLPQDLLYVLDLDADAAHVSCASRMQRGQIAAGELHEASEVGSAAPAPPPRSRARRRRVSQIVERRGLDAIAQGIEPHRDRRDRIAEVVEDARRHVSLAGDERLIDEPVPRFDQAIRHAVELRRQHAQFVVALELERLSSASFLPTSTAWAVSLTMGRSTVTWISGEQHAEHRQRHRTQDGERDSRGLFAARGDRPRRRHAKREDRVAMDVGDRGLAGEVSTRPGRAARRCAEAARVANGDGHRRALRPPPSRGRDGEVELVLTRRCARSSRRRAADRR